MAQYRKKPVVIEAEQWIEKRDYIVRFPDTDPRSSVIQRNGKFFIRTLEGDHEVTDRDFIITGVKGERYPCKPDIFEATYETV
jgi:hypothetical protein